MAKQWTPETVEKMTSEEVREVFFKNLVLQTRANRGVELSIIVSVGKTLIFDGNVSVDLTLDMELTTVHVDDIDFHIPYNATYTYDSFQGDYAIRQDNIVWYIGSIGIIDTTWEEIYADVA